MGRDLQVGPLADTVRSGKAGACSSINLLSATNLPDVQAPA